MTRKILGKLLSAVLLCAPLALAQVHEAATPAPKLAITFDDLPAHGTLPPGVTRLDVVSQIAAALREAHVPPTYGFTNGSLVQQQPADAAVLKAWVAAGNKLGNHTWSHMNLNQHEVQDFQADLTRNESLLAEHMNDGQWRWLRFPYLAQGNTPQKQAAVRSFLAKRGYRIAGVTMSFADYMYTEPYARCSAKGDTQAIALLEKAFLDSADETVTYTRNMSQSLFGRDIPYVLLMHLGALDAKMLPRLLTLYQSRGFRFVSLEEAESDSFYRSDTDLTTAASPDSLEGAMGQRGLPLPRHTISLPDFDKLCR